MSTKPTLPRDVAVAIERKRNRTDGLPMWSNADFIDAYLRGIGDTQKTLRTISVDTLMAALINGYEVEKSAEELAEEARRITHGRIRIRYDTCRRIERLGWLDSATEQSAFAAGMKYVLNELGEKIPGVNAPEGGTAS